MLEELSDYLTVTEDDNNLTFHSRLNEMGCCPFNDKHFCLEISSP